MTVDPERDAFADLASISASQHGVFTFGDAVQAGIPKSTLCRHVKKGRYERVGPRTYRSSHVPKTFESALTAAALSVCGVASHISAAILWGLSRAERFDAAEIHTTIEPNRLVSAISSPRPGWTVHRRWLPDTDVTDHSGVPVTTVARTLRDLAWMVSPRSEADKAWYRLIVDDALDAGLVKLDDLEDQYRRTSPRCPYSKIFRRTLEARLGLGSGCSGAAVTESRFERIFLSATKHLGWNLATQHQFEWRRNCAQRSDVVILESKLIVELDGRRGHSTMSDRESDRRRDAEALSNGWATIRIGWHEFQSNRRRVIDRLDEIVRNRRDESCAHSDPKRSHNHNE